MGRASASVRVPGLASEAEALWYDPARWPVWIDGFGHVVELSDGWPAEGRLVWNSTPGRWLASPASGAGIWSWRP